MSSTDHGGGKRRGDFIAVSVVNKKPQISADDFSILQFIGSNLVFAATVLHRTKMLPLAQKLAEAASSKRPLFYQLRGRTSPVPMKMRQVFGDRQASAIPSAIQIRRGIQGPDTGNDSTSPNSPRPSRFVRHNLLTPARSIPLYRRSLLSVQWREKLPLL
jgi:hypothetical protein